MAKTTITLEDLPDGKLKLSLVSDVTPIKSPMTNAQMFGVLAHSFLTHGCGAPISELVPVDFYVTLPPIPRRG